MRNSKNVRKKEEKNLELIIGKMMRIESGKRRIGKGQFRGRIH